MFRRLFTIPLFERLLLSANPSSSGFLQKLIPPDYLYKQGSTRHVTRDGIHYQLDISHVVDHYLYYGFADPSYVSVQGLISNAKVILDIGANIGSTALYFSKLSPQAQVIAFEPHPETYKRAEKNIALNAVKNIRLLNLGLGESKSVLKLYEVNAHNPGMNRIIAGNKDLPFKNVYIDTLDQVLAEQNITEIDFIKIDVEGFEYAVLAGGARIISATKPVLFIELDDSNLSENNRSAAELVALLVSFGYTNIYRAHDLAPVKPGDDFKNCHYDLIARQAG